MYVFKCHKNLNTSRNWNVPFVTFCHRILKMSQNFRKTCFVTECRHVTGNPFFAKVKSVQWFEHMTHAYNFLQQQHRQTKIKFHYSLLTIQTWTIFSQSKSWNVTAGIKHGHRLQINCKIYRYQQMIVHLLTFVAVPSRVKANALRSQNLYWRGQYLSKLSRYDELSSSSIPDSACTPKEPSDLFLLQRLSWPTCRGSFAMSLQRRHQVETLFDCFFNLLD